MPQALIKINGVVGSDDDLPINTLVQLDNQNIGGEVSYFWEILDQPAGTADTLSSQTIQNPTFTPKKEGTYLIRLTVNDGLPSEDVDTVIAAVRQLKTRERIPAAGETLEDDASRGWASDINVFLQTLDSFIADPGTAVGVNNTGGTLARGTVVRVTSTQTIKSGLPGEEDLPGFTTAPATTATSLDELLLIVEGGVDGTTPVAAGGLTVARWLGRISALSLGAGAVGDPVYVSDSAGLSISPGTNIRQVGSIAAVDGADRDIWFAGTQGGNQAPSDRAYVVYGDPGSLTNAHRVDGLNASGIDNSIPFTLEGGDATTVPFVVRRYSAGTTADLLQVQDETTATLLTVDEDGLLLAPQVQAGDTSFAMDGSVAGIPQLHFDRANNDRIEYDRAVNKWLWKIGGTIEFSLDADLATFAGDVNLSAGGLAVGYSAAAAQIDADTIYIADSSFKLVGSGTSPAIWFDTSAGNDYLEYDRSSNSFAWFIAGTKEMSLAATGLDVVNKLSADDVEVGDVNYLLQLDGTPDPVIQFDSGPDQIRYDRSENAWVFEIGGAEFLTLDELGTGIRFSGAAEYQFVNNDNNITCVEIDGGTAAPTLRLIPEGNDPTADLQAGAFYVESNSEGLHQYNSNFAEWVPIVEQIQHTAARVAGSVANNNSEVIHKDTFGLNFMQHRPNLRWEAYFIAERAGTGSVIMEWKAINGTFPSGDQASISGTVLAAFTLATGSGTDKFRTELLVRFANDTTTFDIGAFWMGNGSGEVEVDTNLAVFTVDDTQTEFALVITNSGTGGAISWEQFIVTVEQM